MCHEPIAPIRYILFTKDLCMTCQIAHDLVKPGAPIRIVNLSNIDAERLAILAWHEQVDQAERMVPILIRENSSESVAVGEGVIDALLEMCG